MGVGLVWLLGTEIEMVKPGQGQNVCIIPSFCVFSIQFSYYNRRKRKEENKK